MKLKISEPIPEIKKGREKVNIDEVNELKELIKKIAHLSVEKGVTAGEVAKAISAERKLYQVSLKEIPEETEDEKRFRAKAEIFFREKVCWYFEELRRLEDNPLRAEYEIANVIEIACASYKLFKKIADINQKTIYEKAKFMMKSKPQGTNGRGNSWGGKFYLIQEYSKTDFEKIADKLFEKNKQLKVECHNFMNQYEYRPGTEANVLRIIFLIENL